MRLRTLNRAMTLAVSAGLAATTTLTGCHPKPPAAGRATIQPSSRRPVVPATTQSTATTVPTSGPTTDVSQPPAVPPTTAVAATEPATTNPAATNPTAVAPTTVPTDVATAPPATVPVAVAPPVPATAPAVASLPPVHNAERPDDPQTLVGDRALASRLNSAAELAVPAQKMNRQTGELVFREVAALDEAAAELDYTNPRYSRLLADAYRELGDVPAEASALYAATSVERKGNEDELGLIRLLDLILSHSDELENPAYKTLETADGRVAFLTAILDDTRRRAGFRADAAVRCAALLHERGQEKAADAMIAQALLLNPVSVEALRVRYARLPADATEYERLRALLDLCRANPVSPAFTGPVADLVASHGLVQESLDWYAATVQMQDAVRRPDPRYIGDWAAELFLADQQNQAVGQAVRLVQMNPADPTGWYLQLLIARSANDQAGFDKTMQLARNAMANRIADVVNRADAAGPPPAGAASPPRATTRPLDAAGPAQLPDLAVTVAQLGRAKSPPTMPATTPSTVPSTMPATTAAAATADLPTPAAPVTAAGPDPAAGLRTEFVDAVGDLAWLELYFAQDPAAAAPLVAAVQGVLPDGDPFLVQLQGWSDLAAKNPAAAMAKLSSVAAKNPLAMLGKVKLTYAGGEADKASADDLARALVQANPSGLIGAMLQEALRSNRVRVVPTRTAEQIRQQLSAFPKTLLSVAGRPNNFYLVQVAPTDVARTVGDPLTAVVYVRNMCGQDLSVGDDGVIQPDLAFELHTSIDAANAPPFRAVDSLAGPVVLHPGTGGYVQQTVRLDQTPLLSHLLANPAPQVTVTGLAYIDPRTPLGQFRTNMTQPFVREAINVNNYTKAKADLQANAPDTQIAALEVVQTSLSLMAANQAKQPDANAGQELAAQLDAIRSLKTSPVPAVAAWAARCEFFLSGEGDRPNLAMAMAEDPDWRHRQVALVVAIALPPQVRGAIFDKLAADPQSSVRAQAQAMRGLAALPPPPPAPAGPATAPAVTP